MITDNNVEYPNIQIQSIRIVSQDGGSSIELYNRDDYKTDGYFAFDKLFIEEDMFGGPVLGSFEFYDSVYLIEQLNLTNDDKIFFTLDGKEYYFRILDVNINSDLASKKTHGPGGSVYKVSLRFTSDEFYRSNFEFQPVENFIGKISKGKIIKNDGSSSEETVTIQSATPELPINPDHENQMTGFLQEIMKYATLSSRKPISADNTSNDIWFKTEPTFYPFSKVSSPSKIFQIMNYATEYSCYAKNPKAVNFFFWEDLDKWNFRCIESLLDEENLGTYVPGLEEYRENAIVSMETLSDISPIKLFDGGALKSEYIRVKPNWGDPYRGFIDTAGGLTKENISYNYQDDANKWKKIAAYGPFKKSYLDLIAEDPFDVVSFKPNRINDTNYGYYSNSYNTKNVPWWNHLDPMHDHALGERIKKIKNVKDQKEYFEKVRDVKETARLENEYWQSQFDFCELPGSYLRKIYKEIKWNPEIAKNRREYVKLKRYQKKLEVYKRKICCEREVPSEFFALIIGADKIYGGDGVSFAYDSGGIYAYRWIEVEMWPRDDVDYILNTSQQIIKFEEKDTIGTKLASYPFVFSAPYWALEGMARKETTVDIKDGTGKVILKKKTYTPETRAFNIGELLNSAGSTLFEDPSSFEGDNQKIKTLLINPGITTILDKSQIALEEQGKYTSYPKNFSMMPVGKFRVISETCPDWLRTGEVIEKAAGNAGGFYFAGRIVKMNAIPREAIDTLKINDFFSETPAGERQDGITATVSRPARGYLFTFDVDNAHDGLCIDCT